MKIGKGLVWLILQCHICTSYAGDLFVDWAQIGRPNNMTLVEFQKQKYNLVAMMVGCELDEKCMLKLLSDIIKNDQNPIYTSMLSTLIARKDKIELDNTQCNSNNLRMMKKQFSLCLAQMMSSKEHIDDTNKIKNTLDSCIEDKMEALAKEGNLFALGKLLEHAIKIKDNQSAQKWYERIENQSNTPEYQIYQKCTH